MDVVEAVIAMIHDLEETDTNYQGVRALKRMTPNLRKLTTQEPAA